MSWINPRLEPGEVQRVVTGIPGKTGVVYTLDRATGEFPWATPTITQNVIAGLDGATGAVTESAELVFTAEGLDVLACPHASGGKDWEPAPTPRSTKRRGRHPDKALSAAFVRSAPPGRHADDRHLGALSHLYRMVYDFLAAPFLRCTPQYEQDRAVLRAPAEDRSGSCACRWTAAAILRTRATDPADAL